MPERSRCWVYLPGFEVPWRMEMTVVEAYRWAVGKMEGKPSVVCVPTTVDMGLLGGEGIEDLRMLRRKSFYGTDVP